ncbi:MAG: hypothetical protein QXL89_02125 [Nitrososphaeria archaeon]
MIIRGFTFSEICLLIRSSIHEATSLSTIRSVASFFLISSLKIFLASFCVLGTKVFSAPTTLKNSVTVSSPIT